MIKPQLLSLLFGLLFDCVFFLTLSLCSSYLWCHVNESVVSMLHLICFSERSRRLGSTSGFGAQRLTITTAFISFLASIEMLSVHVSISSLRRCCCCRNKQDKRILSTVCLSNSKLCECTFHSLSLSSLCKFSHTLLLNIQSIFNNNYHKVTHTTSRINAGSEIKATLKVLFSPWTSSLSENRNYFCGARAARMAERKKKRMKRS